MKKFAMYKGDAMSKEAAQLYGIKHGDEIISEEMEAIVKRASDWKVQEESKKLKGGK